MYLFSSIVGLLISLWSVVSGEAICDSTKYFTEVSGSIVPSNGSPNYTQCWSIQLDKDVNEINWRFVDYYPQDGDRWVFYLNANATGQAYWIVNASSPKNDRLLFQTNDLSLTFTSGTQDARWSAYYSTAVLAAESLTVGQRIRAVWNEHMLIFIYCIAGVVGLALIILIVILSIKLRNRRNRKRDELDELEMRRQRKKMRDAEVTHTQNRRMLEQCLSKKGSIGFDESTRYAQSSTSPSASQTPSSHRSLVGMESVSSTSPQSSSKSSARSDDDEMDSRLISRSRIQSVAIDGPTTPTDTPSMTPSATPSQTLRTYHYESDNEDSIDHLRNAAEDVSLPSNYDAVLASPSSLTPPTPLRSQKSELDYVDEVLSEIIHSQ